MGYLELLGAIFILYGIYLLVKKFLFAKSFPPKPEALKVFGTLYYGDRSAGKTLHQADQIVKTFEYWKWLYKKHPELKRGILMTNTELSPNSIIGNEDYYYYFEELDELRFCPRKNCWRGKKQHSLHGAIVVLDDISTLLPPDSWQLTPVWFRKYWTQAGHMGLHFLFNCQEPTAYDINARRATELCYRFSKIIGSRRPDETLRPVNHIWGFYVRHKIKAKWLWQFGDLEPAQIQEFKEGLKARKKLTGINPFPKIWQSSLEF